MSPVLPSSSSSAYRRFLFFSASPIVSKQKSSRPEAWTAKEADRDAKISDTQAQQGKEERERVPPSTSCPSEDPSVSAPSNATHAVFREEEHKDPAAWPWEDHEDPAQSEFGEESPASTDAVSFDEKMEGVGPPYSKESQQQQHQQQYKKERSHTQAYDLYGEEERIRWEERSNQIAGEPPEEKEESPSIKQEHVAPLFEL